MRFFRYTILNVLLIVLVAACLRKQLHSIDFTAEHVFTEGIEGPAVSPDGDLFAVNFERQGTIGKVDALGQGQVYVDLPEGSIGNGIRFDIKGDMYIADYTGHNIYRIPSKTKKPEIWVSGPEMSQPNDLAVSDQGALYLSDPDWKNGSGRLWLVTPEKKLILIEENMGTTNGIELSPDGKNLYVNESLQRRIWRYDVLADGKLTNKTLFTSFDDYGLDGMRCDMEGNLYITRFEKGSVLILSTDARIIDEVLLKGKNPTNISFGGPDGKTCFVTVADRGCIEIFRAPFPGNYYSKTHN